MWLFDILLQVIAESVVVTILPSITFAFQKLRLKSDENVDKYLPKPFVGLAQRDVLAVAFPITMSTIILKDHLNVF